MRVPCFSMMSLCSHTIINHEDGSYRGVGTCPAERHFCFRQGSAHELFVSVGCHDADESTTRAWRNSNPQPSDPKFFSCLLDSTKFVRILKAFFNHELSDCVASVEDQKARVAKAAH
jgi:hypothetical protein